MLRLPLGSSANEDAADPIAHAFRACRRHFVHAALFSAFLNLLYLTPTLYMLQVYDRVVPTRGATTLAMLTAILATAVLSIAALDLVRTRLLVRASAQLDRDLAGPILDALLRLPSAARARSTNILREFDTLRQTMTGVGVLALFDAPWAPIYILVCFLLHPALAGLAVVGAVLLSGLSWLNERGTVEPIKRANQAAHLSYVSIDSTLAASGIVGALGMRQAMVRRHLRDRRCSTTLVTDTAFVGAGYTSVIKALRLLLQSIALGLGALLAIEGRISLGSLFAASLLVSRALQPIELINGAWKNIIQGQAAYKSLAELFRVRGTQRRTTELPDPVGALLVESLTVASPTGDRAILQGIRFDLYAGESLGIIGASGAGKSTLVQAIAGVVPSAQGTIRLDGAALEDWPEEQLGRAIGYVPQQPTLFRGTIKENISRFQTELSPPGVLDEQVIRAAKLCGAHEMILRLPQAYDTELGWGGAGLSVGQAQRITLARALFGAPSIVILDEPNASLDADGEAQLTAALNELRANKVTMIIVAHRAGILQSVDKLMVLRDGRMELFGARNAVLARLASKPGSTSRAASEPSQGATPANPIVPVQ